MEGKPRSKEIKLKILVPQKALCPSEERARRSEIAKVNGFGLWNKGKIRSEETRLKMSLAAKARCTPEWRVRKSESVKANGFGLWNKGKKGKPRSAKTKLKISQSIIVTYDKIGRKTDLDPNMRDSLEHNEWRKAVFKKNNYICQDCGQVGGELNAHHIFQWSFNELFRYLLWNGVTLCVKCHKKIKVQYKKKV